MLVLGLSAFEHGGAAAVVRDGVPVSAAQEDRWSRSKGDPAFPLRAARSCLRLAGATSAEVDLAVFHSKPLRRFERVLATELGGFPRSARSFAHAMFTWLGDRLWIRGRIADELGLSAAHVGFCEHAASQAAGAFMTSPFDEAGVLVAGYAGEWAATSLFAGSGANLEVLAEQDYPHSLADLCDAAVAFLGFEPEDAPRVLSELAAHGQPRFVDGVRALVEAEDGGAFRFAPGALPAPGSDGVFGPAWEEHLGAPRAAASTLCLGGADSRHADIAASVQAVLEETLLALANELHGRTGARALCLAGELADNPRAAARVLADGPFERLHLQPAAGAGGAALGAALLAAAGAGAPRANGDAGTLLLGEPVVDLDEKGEVLADADARVGALLARLQGGACVGWVRGRFALGDPSPGDRIVLADPCSDAAAAQMRDGVLRLDEHRGFALAIRVERAAELLELPSGAEGPLAAGRLSVPARDALRERAPLAVHADGGARPLLVSAERDPELHALLARFEEGGGAPVLLCETLAARGEPPVRGALDARGLFERSDLGALVVEGRLFER